MRKSLVPDPDNNNNDDDQNIDEQNIDYEFQNGMKIGEVLFGKLSGFNWWPCKVSVLF